MENLTSCKMIRIEMTVSPVQRQLKKLVIIQPFCRIFLALMKVRQVFDILLALLPSLNRGGDLYSERLTALDGLIASGDEVR